jgi:hypothetical protein
VGLDPIEATDLQWCGALRLVDAFDDIHYVRALLENTAKESKKPKSRSSGLGRFGRRR